MTATTNRVLAVAVPPRRRVAALVILFGAAGFLGALLLFTMEPLAAKALLPVLGGSAAVWNTAMAFFQIALLGGYLTAHVTSTRLPVRWRIPVQLVILALPLLALPFGLPGRRPATASPMIWELGALAVMVGAPFFALATLSPTVQAWFSRTEHPRARDPFFLYAASNVGSFLGLLAYPLLIEPRLDLMEQGLWFRWAYLLLVFISVAAAFGVRRGQSTTVARGQSPDVTDNKQRLFWVAAAAVPSLMLLAVSRHIATDVASFPLLWVVPLALYLGTFILAFSRFSHHTSRAGRLAFPFVAIPAAVASTGVLVNIWLGLGLPLALLITSGLLAHGRLYQRRPSAARLTEFYMWVSVGGAIGGMVGAFVAPVLFETVAEYPIAIVATAALLGGRPGVLRMPVKLLLAAVYVISLILAVSASELTIMSLLLGLGGIAAYGLVARSSWLALGLAGVLVVGMFYSDGRLLIQDRTFFGVYRVLESSSGQHILVSGTTIHGAQQFEPDPDPTPLTYYAPAGPIGEVMREIGSKSENVGVIGLGAGALASYLGADQTITFYEIDPAVVELATNPELFTFTTGSPAEVTYVLGDGRLTLEQPHPPFGLLILDAFTSDAIPSHLLTVEAVRTYLDSITSDGVIGFHISNRHLDLEPVVGRLAAELGLTARVRDYQPPVNEGSAVTFVVAARSAGDLGSLATNPDWRPPRIGPDLWTDAFSNLLNVVRWG